MAFLHKLGFGRTHAPLHTPIEQANLVEKDSISLEMDFQRLQRRYRTLQRWTAGFAICLVMALVSLLLTQKKSPAYVPTKEHPLSNASTTIVTFERDPLLSSTSSPESDDGWAAQAPMGDGFVLIDNPDALGLPPGKNSSKGQIYDVSMWHQMHCLRHIRTFLYTLKTSALDATSNTTAIWSMILEQQEDHVGHCFDYIRQGIMCAGDMALEWPRTEPDGRRFAVDGWGIQHQCKRWDAIMEYMDQHSVTSKHHT